MKKIFLLALIITTTVSSFAQQQITIISGKENNYCNAACTLVNIPELINNPDAIIFVTPIAKILHPIIAYYTVKQWSILNLDNSPMIPGTQFSVQYYTQPDTNHFVHVVTQQNLQKNGSYIDHAGLNDNPNAQIRFFQNWAPSIRGGLYNRYDIKIQYDTTAGRWYMFNVNGRQLDYADAYNIAISSGGNANTIPVLGKSDIIVDPNNPKILTKSTDTIPVLGKSNIIVDPNNPNILTNNNNNAGAGWSLSGANLYSTNQGFVGIAWKTPTAPLGFSPSLGKKISLYPGATGDVGFGVSPNRLQIYADNPNADVAIGYDAAGTFNERLAVKANGALAVNGNTGTTGQILQSNGPGTAATWIKKPYVFFSSGSTGGQLNFGGTSVNTRDLPGIAGSTFTLDQPSKIVYSFSSNIKAVNCDGCGDSYGFITIEIKAMAPESQIDFAFNTYYVIRNGEFATLSDTHSSIYSYPLPAGNYIIYATTNRDNSGRGEISVFKMDLTVEVFPE